MKIPVIFDTGASESVVTSKMLENIKTKDIVNVDKEFALIDGSIIKVRNAVDIEFLYNNKKFSERFNIVKNSKNAEILLCNRIVKKIRNIKQLPIECTIDTTNNSPVSWNRPIILREMKLK
ncbi:hypothetical protein DMUE_4180 [Dictyocoela muelleri]|nr:hypothetical protein DMUE_4180 [Dictyocoela muelleri]